ncbi:S8 family peptidase [Isoptericola sp. NPDC060282]|uniref:S8 family peptidase n=1 Tax=Isoptericola sp. NPDC060282 TaxID=3347093 RepID=UPI003650045E
MTRGSRRTTPRTGPTIASVVAGALALAALQAPLATTASPPAAADAEAAAAGDAAPVEHRVTLVTGDVVLLQEWPDGRRGAALLPDERGQVRHNAFVTETEEGLFVIPEQARDLVNSGAVDQELFNVTSLVEQGYDDASTAQLPLILGYDGKARLARADVPDGSSQTRSLTSIDAVGVRESKKLAKRFWRDLVRQGTGERRPALTDGVSQVWLDAQVEATLDRSTAQIGAPTAWEAGLDGTGTEVAVLDSGIDLTHPDLAGKVIDSRNFTAEESITDTNGHGTHVASTIAGTGAASGGTYRGVAPGAELVIGKVLDATGRGSTSAVIDGMEWAAHTGADIVSMSLGSGPSDGDDPASLAGDRLTQETGALFVVAAGNDGPTPGTASSPSTARSALSVAAVDRGDRIASFSSRGPTANGTLKPDVSAPGVDIVAARAAGTSRGTVVDAHYTALSGTSMAAPHVSGAAAILVQQHPDWSPARLKDALMSTSKTAPAGGGFDQGAGRVDVGRAVTQTLTATGSVSYGLFRYGDATDPVARTVTYTNDGDAPLTLDLAVRGLSTLGEALPAAMVTTSSDTVTVPAHGTADVRLTADPAQGPTGRITGDLTATPRDGSAPVHTGFGIVKGDQVVEITVHGINHAGQPAYRNSDVSLYNLETGATQTHPFNSRGEAYFSVKPGTYSVMGYLASLDEPGTQVVDFTLAPMPELTLAHSTEITLDGTQAEEVTVDTPKPAEHRGLILGYERGSGPKRLSQVAFLDQYVDHVYAVPTDQVTGSPFRVFTQWQMYAPELRVTEPRTGAAVTTPEYVVGSPKLDGTSVLKVAPVGGASEADLAGTDLSGRLALIRADAGSDLADQVAAVAEAGAAAALVYATEPGRFLTSAATTIPAMTLDAGPGAALARQADAGDLRLKVVGVARSKDVYDLYLPWNGQIPEDTSFTVDGTTTARIEADYHNPSPAPYGKDLRWAYPTGATLATSWSTPRLAPSPAHRTEWLSTTGVEWERFAYSDDSYGSVMKDPRTAFRAGDVLEESWHRSPLRPAIPVGRPDLNPTRSATQMNFGIVPWVDGGNEHEGQYWYQTDKFSTQLFARDQLILKRTTAIGSWPAPYAEPTEYRLVMDGTRTADWAPMSTRTRSEWTFTSAKPESGTAPIPLVQLYYDLPLDLENRAPAGEPFTFSVRTAEPGMPGSPTASELTAEVSTDDGETWEQAVVAADGAGKFTVTTPAAPQAGYVSLRIAAADADGSSVEQTVIRAYGVR